MNGSDMGLLDDLNNIKSFTKSGGARCSVCTLLDSITETEAALLSDLMKNPDVAYSALSRALKSNGHVLSQGTLARHAKGECNGTR
jgi:hypothetical protein